MRHVSRKVIVRGNRGFEEVDALFDTGATQTYIRRELAERIGDLIQLSKPASATLADGTTKMAVTHRIALDIDIDGKVIDWLARVADNLSHQLIVGAPTMQTFNILIDLSRDRIVVEEIDTSEAIG